MELIAMFIGVLFMGLTNLAKRKGIDQKAMTLGLVGVLALGYAIFVTFTSAEFQAEVIGFVMTALGSAKVIYDMATMNKSLPVTK